jgi:hypothetical protein
MFFLHLFFLVHLCASYLFFLSLCVQSNPQARSQLSPHAILVLIPMPYLIVATSCRFLFLHFFFSLLQWAIVPSIWVKVVFLLLTHTPSSFFMH